MLLPSPSHGIPASRPYTAATYVDLDAEVPVPPAQLGTLHPDDSQVSASADASQQPDADLGPEPVPQMPQTSITFLLVSGRRRTMSFEPDTTVGRVKELVWNAWPSEWQDERPPAPSYLRILYLGKLLQDDDTLTKLSFPSYTPPASSQSTSTTPPLPSTIVHLSIRPYALPSDDDALKKKGRRRTILGRGGAGPGDGEDGEVGAESAGCCGGCVIC